MSMYKKDHHGVYQVIDTFIEASAGWWAKCEVRKYEDGSMNVHRDQEKYIADHPDKRELHAIYMLAKRGLE